MKNKIRRGGKQSTQSSRDYERIQTRIQQNGSKIEYVSNFLDRYFRTHVTSVILLSLARIFIRKLDLTLDRLAKRNRTALLCWFAENWDPIYAQLKRTDFLTYVANQGFPDENGQIQSSPNPESELSLIHI